MRVTGDPTPANNGVFYLLGDHLGSTSVSYRVSDGQTLTQRYYAWGGIRPGPNNALPTDYTFTGQKLDATGLMYYGARYYDSSLGRFLSADTIVPQAGNPQALNRYSYVNNNPLKYVDPSGHCWGFASGLRGTGAYGATCNNIDMALTIVQSPKTSAGQKAGAGAYLFAEGAAHIAVAAGTAVLAGEGIAAAGTALSGSAAATGAAGTASTAATAACADGDCTNEVATTEQVASKGLSGAAQFWNKVTTFKDIKVYQRDDIIDPNLVDKAGLNNLARMKLGRSPIGPDGATINLHHMLQTADSALAEVTQTFHQTYSRVIHINPNTIKSGIDRAAFGAFRAGYWMQRAKDFEPQ
jgi:RHS repeat-associated protein